MVAGESLSARGSCAGGWAGALARSWTAGGQPGGIKVNAATRRRMGLSKDQARRGVHALHSDRLVTIHVGGRGRCMEVELTSDPKEPSVPAGSPTPGLVIAETTGAPAEAG